MRALLSRHAGAPETLTLEDIPTPKVGAGMVLVSVRACGVNYPDVLIINDLYQFRPERPFAPGSEFAGVITQIGDGVTDLTIGHRVAGFVLWGAMAEELAVDAKRVFRIPAAMPFEEAAACLVTYGTAYHALKERAALSAGETVLVLGAAGGVGVAAVDICTALGAHVIAAASSERKITVAKNRGAAHGIVYPLSPLDQAGQRQLARLFKQAVGDNGANVIVDTVGGDYTEAALRCIGWGGRLLVIGFPSGIPRIPLNLVLLKGCQIVGVFFGGAFEHDPSRFRTTVETLFELYTTGKIKPYISERYSLSQGAQAISRLASREATGKIVITMEAL